MDAHKFLSTFIFFIIGNLIGSSIILLIKSKNHTVKEKIQIAKQSFLFSLIVGTVVSIVSSIR